MVLGVFSRFSRTCEAFASEFLVNLEKMVQLNNRLNNPDRHLYYNHNYYVFNNSPRRISVYMRLSLWPAPQNFPFNERFDHYDIKRCINIPYN